MSDIQGLIQNNISAGDKLSPDALQQAMNIPEPMKVPLQKVVLAGLKVMFSPQSHGLMQKQLQAPGPMPQKLGQGVAGLVCLLFQQSKRTIPPQLLIPAGVILMGHVVDFLKKAQQPVSGSDVGQGFELMVSEILRAFHLDINQVMNNASKKAAQIKQQDHTPSHQQSFKPLIGGAQ